MGTPEVMPKLSPYEMYDRFCNLKIQRAVKGPSDAIILGGEILPFCLNNYLCNNPLYGGAAQALKLKDILLGVTWGSGPKPQKLYQMFGLAGAELMAVFCGKGTAMQMEKALSLVDFVIREKPAVLKTAFPKLVNGGVQYMADMPEKGTVLIGLDCNGFVGNWQMAAGFVGVSPSSAIQWWPNKGKRTKLSDVHEYDVCCFENNSHIVVIDEVKWDGSKLYANICQSTGRMTGICGPQYSTDHQITASTTPGIFEIHPNGSTFTTVVFTSKKRVRILSSGFRDTVPS